MKKKTDKNYRTVEPVKRQGQQKKKQVIVTYFVFNTILYIKYFFHVLTDNGVAQQDDIEENTQ